MNLAMPDGTRGEIAVIAVIARDRRDRVIAGRPLALPIGSMTESTTEPSKPLSKFQTDSSRAYGIPLGRLPITAISAITAISYQIP